ncbi:MAG: hypothetical protein A2020_09150 [Lentisphaerae bacterium GWF2_45_14]|nr:MAG: hypothetical protein A2020_09150 [Lentisphaerae bacterium GWF2_45_14]
MSENPLIPVEISFSPKEKHQSSSRIFQGIPGIEVSKSGRIWATWYSGGSAEGPENYVFIVSSSDNGSSWSDPVAVIDPPGNVRAYDPVLWHDQQGRLWWFWSQSLSPADGKIHDGRAGVWCAFTEDSDSKKPLFSKPIHIANGVMMNKPTFLSNGEWALPTAVWEYYEPKLDEFKNERFSNIVISEDSGKSFYLRGRADVPSRAFDEHMIIELKDKRLWMLVRTCYGVGQSFSSDMGKTWTPGEDSGLGGPNSRFFIRRLSSGKLLLINHVNPETGEKMNKRSHLSAFLSDDDGKRWKGGLLLDEREKVSYPDGVEDKNGVIRVIYDRNRFAHRDGEADILMASFREEDVLSGKCVTSDARLKILINRINSAK